MPGPDDLIRAAAGRALPQGGVTQSVTDSQSSTGGQAVPLPPATLPPSAERYALLDEIAQGGMGVIYRAMDTALGREVAVKVLQERFAPGSGTARRFADEAHIAAQLQHPGIPPVHDLGILPDGRPFLAMKLIKGQTLEALLAARPDVSADRGRFVAAFEQACQAVAYAHAHDVIHRDLKPANVMVGSFGEVQVMDWGIAKVLSARPGNTTDPGETRAGTEVRGQGDSDGLVTQAGSILGTLAYMAPEQAGGEVAAVDRRSDVFGLGAILCVILTGHPPYRGPGAEAIRLQAIRGQLADAFARLDACGAEPELVGLARRCLAELPSRPADAGEVADAVARLRSAAEERARRAELERAAAEVRAAEQRKRRRVWFALASALLLGAAASVVFAVLARQAEAQAVEERDLKEEARGEAAANEQKARAAEEARHLELGRTAAAAAQLAAGRGKWDEALRLYDTALAAGGGDDEIELRLGRCGCRMALGQVRPALAELDELAGRPDLGRFSGPVLLCQAENALWRQGGGDPRDLARRAIEKGLPPADAAYARAFLAQSAPEAIKLLQEAARLDPLHSRGLDFLAMLLFITGHREELREAVTQLRLSHPDSAAHLMCEIFLRAMDGDRDAAERLVARIEATGYAEMGPFFRTLIDLLVLAQGEDFFFGSLPAQRLASFMTEYARMAELSSRLAGDKNASDARLGNMRHFQLPMFQALAETPPIRGLTASGPIGVLAALQQPAKVADAFGAAAQTIPDGSFFLLHGIFLLQAGQLPEAEAAFRRALEHPSWANHRRAARFYLVRAQWQLASSPKTPPNEQSAWKEKALANLRDLAYSGAQPLPPESTVNLVHVAVGCGDPALGLALTEAALRKNPNDLRLLGRKLLVEVELSALDRAETTARTVTALLQAGVPLSATDYQALVDIADGYDKSGRRSDALRWCDLVRERLMQAGADDPKLIDAWTNLGVRYWRMKQFDQSVPIFERVHAANRKSLGERHRTTLHAQANLGVNYRDAGRLKEAIPLLEQVDREGRHEPSLQWVRGELVTAYIAARQVPEAMKLVKEILAEARQEHAADGRALAGALVQAGQSLVRLGSWDEAESVLREALRLREKLEPEAWNTFNAQSLLGEALAGQKKYADAESMLVQGFDGLKARAAQIPEQYRALRLAEAADRLVRLCEAQGRNEEAAKWRKEREATRKP
jgi:tetratricopeptide (TPR) repeat protein